MLVRSYGTCYSSLLARSAGYLYDLIIHVETAQCLTYC